MLESVENVRKTGKINVEIFHVVAVHMLGKIILEDRKVVQYGLHGNKGHLFF